MRTPFRNPFTREANYTDSVITAFLAEAAGLGNMTAAQTGALEACVGMWGRCFASASVVNPGLGGASLDASTLNYIARELCRSGQSLHLIELDVDNRVRLIPVAQWDVAGESHDPTTWTYAVDLTGPSGTTRRLVPAAGVLVCKYAVDGQRPWVGLGPLQVAAATGRLAGFLEKRTGDESGLPAEMVLPTPRNPKRPGDTDSTSPQAKLEKDIKDGSGKVLIVETMKSGHGDPSNAPIQDWGQKRIGAMIPETSVSLRNHAAVSIMGACGIPPALLQESSDGTAQRESLRRFLHTTIGPIAKIVQSEFRDKLLAPALELSFEDLFAADVTGRARAWRSLVGKDAVLDPATAAKLVGLQDNSPAA